MDLTIDLAAVLAAGGRAAAQLNAELSLMDSPLRLVDIRCPQLFSAEDSLGRIQWYAAASADYIGSLRPLLTTNGGSCLALEGAPEDTFKALGLPEILSVVWEKLPFGVYPT